MLTCEAGGKKLRDDRDVLEVIGEALGQRVKVVVIPAERLDDDFFRLRTGVAGEIVQKFVNYRLRLVIIGDISRHLNASSPLRDFVDESNRGEYLWFVENLEELHSRPLSSRNT